MSDDEVSWNSRLLHGGLTRTYVCVPQQSLLESLDLNQLNCLNETAEHNVKSIFISRKQNTSSSAYLLSDADEQLLINIPFVRGVRVKSLLIKSSGEPGQQPRKIKLFINHSSLGFEDVQDAEEPEASQVIELTDEQVTRGRRIPLRFIFVAGNEGDDQTRIDGIDIFGLVTGGNKDLSGLRNVEEV
ncbi:galactose-binding domain-like protein [Irpex rosettiformis]|uniref:Galactose-binding domain-like protein n=1 Tax=Irpex rosettiformis TaxID=378272 RepID=A0ACB8TXK9_9APHY|nr:galactose-binding domain-like protein [Irpex rosettiformis]